MPPHLETQLRDLTADAPRLFVEDALGRFSGETVRQYRPMVEAAQVAADEAKATLIRWVEAARRAGMSWADVGALVGISKQAAQQRYGREPVPDAPFGTIVVTPGTSGATEQALLDREGAAGRELVGVDATRLLFRQTDRVWQHRRSVDPLAPAAVKAGGWSEAARWFVFTYYKRPASAD